MSGTDWLRTLVKRDRKTATGGIVQPDQTPIQLGGCRGTGYLVYSNPTIQVGDNEPVPVISLTFQEDPAHNRSHPLRCPCVAIYSRCYCHLRKPEPQ